MAYLLDTNIAIHARDGAEAVLGKLGEHKGKTLLSALSLAELLRGLDKNPALTTLRQERLDEFLKSLSVLAFDTAAALAYGRIIAQCVGPRAAISTG